ncbi:hypothetical protein ppKF707_2266 [Metapseudomonas furukawaii]|uniref:Uncharacterized protein n=1 Tax=Metapseudomonas furukawaii TaxID=1149133 RepID=A0AAD1BUZ4_METFU|nr:hypothetical protein ppKF707_2266 [Pseudomonas furukawaii]BAU71806.1 hypothetical protein KF707C_1180 [Pseudomonas furukawaii]
MPPVGAVAAYDDRLRGLAGGSFLQGWSWGAARSFAPCPVWGSLQGLNTVLLRESRIWPSFPISLVK